MLSRACYFIRQINRWNVTGAVARCEPTGAVLRESESGGLLYWVAVQLRKGPAGWHAGCGVEEPRLCARRRLGLPEDASFDEVIDARAFLVEVRVGRSSACLSISIPKTGGRNKA